MSDVTRLLNAAEQGDSKAAGELLPLVYEELRKLAAMRMANEPAGQTLQATALVHEAWLRLLPSEHRAKTPDEPAIFNQTLELDSAEKRAGYIQGACGQDAELHAKVDRLGA